MERVAKSIDTSHDFGSPFSVVRDFGACPWRQRAPDGGLHLRRLGRQRIAHSAQLATQFVDLIEEAEDQRQRLFVDRELLRR